MFLKVAPKEKPIQFTPELEKLFNRVLARVYRGNTRKKCSRQRLLSLQHTQLIKKCNHPLTIVTSRPQKSSHILTRKKQFAPQRSVYTEHGLPYNNQMKKFNSYLSQRSTDGSFGRPDRCKTQATKLRIDENFNKCPQFAADLMVQSELFSGKNNKINPSTIKNRLSLRPSDEVSQQIWKFHNNQSEVIKQTNSIHPCRLKQMENKRRINTIIRTKNKLDADLIKTRQRHDFEPWDVQQNDDLLF